MRMHFSMALAASLLCGSDATLADAFSSAAALKAIDVAARAEPDRTRGRRLVAFYERHQAKQIRAASLSVLDTQEIGALYGPVNLMVFYTGAPRYLSDLERVAIELERRRPLSQSEAEDYVRAMIRARRFEDAASFAARVAFLADERIPYVRRGESAPIPSAYRISAQRDVLEEARPSLSGTRLLIVVHPLCAFSQRAEAALQHMRDLPATLAANTLRLAPVGQRLHLNELRQWNADHGGLEILLARHETDWPMIQDWATPNFYLLQDGRVVDHFSGWPREGHEARFREMVTRFEHCLATTCPGVRAEGN